MNTNSNRSEQVLSVDQLVNAGVSNPNPEREPTLSLLFDRICERATPMKFDPNWRTDGPYLSGVMDIEVHVPMVARDSSDVVLFIPVDDHAIVIARSAKIPSTLIAHHGGTRQVGMARAVDGIESNMRQTLVNLVGPVDEIGNRVFNERDAVPGYLMRLIDQDLPKLSHDDLLNFQLMYLNNDSQLVVDKFSCDHFGVNDLTEEQRLTSVLTAVDSHIDAQLHYLFVHQGEVGFLYTERPSEPFRFFGSEGIGQLLGINNTATDYVSYEKFERLVELFAPKRLDSFRSARRGETLKPVERMLKIERRQRKLREFTQGITKPFNVKVKVHPVAATVAKGTAVTVGVAGLAYLGYRAYEQLSN